MCAVWNFRRKWFSVMWESSLWKENVFKEDLPHPWRERDGWGKKWNPIFVWMRGKKFSLVSDETAMMNAYLLLLILFILTWSEKRVCRAKFVSFLINIFATYCNTLSVNNEMKMRCCRFCNVLWAEGEGESERLWQLVCVSLSAVYDFLISPQVPRLVANNIFL